MVPRPWFERALVPRSDAIPVYMGAVGPRMTHLAGEVADGLLLEMEAMPHSIREHLKRLHAGCAAAARDPSVLETVKLILTSVSSDGRAHPNALGWAAKSVSLLSA